MTIRTLAVTLTAGALLAGAATSPAMAQTATYPTDAGSTATTKAKKKAKKAALRLSDAQQAAVAEDLGVTVAALNTAIAEVKTAVAATEAKETKAEIDALLAGKLGVTVAELRAALDAARPARGERPARGDADYPGDRGGRGGGCDRGSDDSGSYPSDGGSGSYPSDGSGSYPTT